MRRSDVKRVINYYFGIPGMRALLADERAELEDEYNGLRGTSYESVGHSSTPGKPTEVQAQRVDALNVRGRLEEIAVRDHVLVTDQEHIRGCLDVLKGEYKRLIFSRYRDGYSWARLAVQNEVPDRTVRRRHDKAVDRMGEALEEVPMADEIVGRASRARV
jgi:DNA-directed RNA polymerase specialized sigma24 family protein